MKKKNRFKSMMRSASFVYVIMVLALACLLLRFDTPVPTAVALILVSALMLLHLLLERRGRIMKIERYLGLGLSEEAADSENRLPFNVPEPMAGVRVDGTLAWYNKAFSDAFTSGGFAETLEEIFPGVSVDDIIAEKGERVKEVSFGQLSYRLHPTVMRSADPDKAAVVIFAENASDVNLLKSAARDARAVVMNVKVDNYDETVADAGENEQLELSASVDRAITGWVHEAGGLVRKLEKDRYVVVLQNSAFDKIAADKFSILSAVKSITVLSASSPTLSIGVGVGGESPAECDSFARAALDMALGRGGDQAVVCDAGRFSYYGGSTKDVEKRTRVKARVMAQSLKEHILAAENVVVMGHKNADVDAVGAAIGLACAAFHLERDVKILLSGDGEDSAVRSLVDIITKNHYHDGLFVGRGQVKDYVNGRTLLIICDTHRPELVEMPELLDMAGCKAMLDHHRRSESFIEGCDVVYHEPGASSACEMVTEILMYTDGGLSLSTIDATALYAGIILDTKNFVFKTGSRTFEAAAYLRNAGVDTIKVKQLFRESPDDYRVKSDVVASAKIDDRGISHAKVFTELPAALTAQAADDMLDVEGVAASFVISRDGDGARISARSLGEVNVQLICERLGGGGHALAAAAQLKSISVNDAAKKLKAAVDEYFNG